jgi:hypothetical protein
MNLGVFGKRGANRISSNFKIFFLLKMNFFYAFRSFWYAYVKNDFEKIKKLYFNTFLLEKHFELPSLPQS